jgi:hypothetical protein
MSEPTEKLPRSLAGAVVGCTTVVVVLVVLYALSFRPAQRMYGEGNLPLGETGIWRVVYAPLCWAMNHPSLGPYVCDFVDLSIPDE